MTTHSKISIRTGLWLTVALALSSPILRASSFAAGDVFASVNSEVAVFSSSGTLIATLNDGTTGYTAGTAFDSANNLYVTNFDDGTVSKFNSSGKLVNSSYLYGGINGPGSIAVDKAGHFFVGGSVLGSPFVALVNMYSPGGGTPSATFNLNTDSLTGINCIDLAPDQHTLLYDGAGGEIFSYNVSTQTQNAPFAVGLANDDLREFRIIRSGALAGDVLGADIGNAILINTQGVVIRTYKLPGNPFGVSSLSLDPNGTDFWVGDEVSGTVWEVNINTGHIDEQFQASGYLGLSSLSIEGPASGPSAPEPGTLGMLVLSAIGAGVMWRRRTAP